MVLQEAVADELVQTQRQLREHIEQKDATAAAAVRAVELQAAQEIEAATQKAEADRVAATNELSRARLQIIELQTKCDELQNAHGTRRMDTDRVATASACTLTPRPLAIRRCPSKPEAISWQLRGTSEGCVSSS